MRNGVLLSVAVAFLKSSVDNPATHVAKKTSCVASYIHHFVASVDAALVCGNCSVRRDRVVESVPRFYSCKMRC